MKESNGIHQNKEYFKLSNIIRCLVFILAFVVLGVVGEFSCSRVVAHYEGEEIPIYESLISDDVVYDREAGTITFNLEGLGTVNSDIIDIAGFTVAMCHVDVAYEECASSENRTLFNMDWSTTAEFWELDQLVLYTKDESKGSELYWRYGETDASSSGADIDVVSNGASIEDIRNHQQSDGVPVSWPWTIYNLAFIVEYQMNWVEEGKAVYDATQYFVKYVNGRVCINEDECKYYSIDEAIDDNVTDVSLIESLEECVVVPSGVVLTIDMKGKNIVCNEGDNYQAINNSGTLTITNTTSTDSTIEGNGLYVIRNEEDAVSLTMNDSITISGTRTSTSTCIFNSSLFNMNAGVSAECGLGIENDGGQLNIEGGLILSETGLENSGEGVVDIVEGYFETAGMAIDNTDSGSITISGSTMINTDGITADTYIISNSSSSDITITGSAAQIIKIYYDGTIAHQTSVYNAGTLSMSYVEIAGSCTGVYNVGTATLGNVTITSSGMCNDNATDVSQKEVAAYNTGNLTITGSTISGSCTGVYNISQSSVAKVTLSGTSFTSSGACNGYSVGVWSGRESDSTVVSEVEISNSNITVEGSTSGRTYYGISVGYTKLTFTGSTVNGSTFGIYQYTTSEASSSITVNSGTIVSDNGCGIQSRAALTIKSGTVTGATYGIHVLLRYVTIGEKTSTISWTSPLVSGGEYGVYLDSTSASLNFYNGKIRGVTGHVYGTISNESPYAVRFEGTESVSSTTYSYTAYAVATVEDKYYRTIQSAIDSITESGTVKVLVDTAESINITTDKNITLNLNSKEITGNIRNRGTLIINSSGKITSSSTAAITVYASAILNINRVTITGSTYGIYANANSTITIGKDTTALSFDSPLISGGIYGIYFAGSVSEFNFYNGKIRGTTMAYQDGYLSNHSSYGDVVDMEEVVDGTTYYAKVNAAAQVGDNYFPRINLAIDSIETSGTIIVLANRIWDETTYYVTIPSGKDIILDMNGKEILLTMSGAAAMQVFTNNGVLTISGNGTIIGGSTYMPTINNSGTLSILNGTIKNTSNPAISSTGGSITIGEDTGDISWESPLIASTSTAQLYYAINYTNTTLNFYNGMIKSSKVPNGEEYYAINGTITGKLDYSEIVNVEPGVEDSITYYGIAYAIAESGGKYYRSVQGAIDSVATSEYDVDCENSSDTGTIINVLGNTNECLSIVSGKAIILELNGYRIYCSISGTKVIENAGILTVKNGTLETAMGSSVYTAISNTGILNLISTNVNGAILISNSSSGCAVISGGKFVSVGAYAMQNSGTLIIKEGVIEATGTITIDGVVVSTGTLVIGENKNELSWDNPLIKSRGYAIKINGGTFNFYNGKVMGTTSPASGGWNGIYGTVSSTSSYGVIFNDSAVIEDGVTYYPSMMAAAKVGNVYYKSIQEAIDGIEESDTVIVLADREDTFTIPSTKNILLDMNGKSNVYSTSSVASIINNGSLTIAGNGEIRNDTSYATVIENSGQLTITNGSLTGMIQLINGSITMNGGSISSTGYGIYAKSGTVDITEGYVFGSLYGIYLTGNCEVNVGLNIADISWESPVISGSSYGVYVYKGTFNFYNGKVKGLAAPTDTQTANGIYGTITGKSSYATLIHLEETIDSTKYYFSAYALACNNGTCYGRIQDAIDDTITGTIEIVSDSNECLHISSSQDITILMNGKTILCVSEGIPAINNEGILTINEEGTIKSTKYYGILTSNKLVVNDVTINGVNGAIKNSGTGVVEINSGTITGDVIGIENTSSSDTAVTIIGGIIQINDGGTNALNSTQGTVSISGSASLTGNVGVYNAGTLTISGGTITGGLNNAGTLTVSGGTITRSSSNSGSLTVSGGEFVDETKAIDNSGTLTINGGLIRATGDVDGVETYGIYNEEGGSVTLSTNVKNVVGGPKIGIYNVGSLNLSSGSDIGTIKVGDDTIASSVAIYNKGTLGGLSTSISGSAIGIINEGTISSFYYLRVSSTDIAIKNVEGGLIKQIQGSLTGTNYALYNESDNEADFEYTGLYATGAESIAVFSNAGTVIVNNLTIHSPNIGVYNDSGSTMYIKGSTMSIKAFNSVDIKTAILNKGTLNFEADTTNIDGLEHDFVNHGIANISVGTIAAVENNEGTTTISGGVITELQNNGGKTVLTGGTITNVVVTAGEFELNGGTVSEDVTNNGTTNVISGNIVGTVSNNSSGEFNMSNGEINLLENFGTAEITGGIISDINVNGGEVRTAGIINGDISVNDGVAYILGGEIQGEASNQATLYIEGGTVAHLANDGDVTMSGGVVLSITNSSGDIIINGGIVTKNIENSNLLTIGEDTEKGVSAVVEGEIRNKGTLDISGGTVNKVVNLAGSASVSGGSITNFENTVELNVSGGSISVLMASGAVTMTGGSIQTATIDQTTLTMSGGFITSSLVNNGQAIINDAGVVSGVITNNFDLAIKGGEIYSVANIATISIEGGTIGRVTVDGVTSTAETAINNTNNGVITMSAGSVIANKYGIYNESGSTNPVTISGGSVEVTSTDSLAAGIYTLTETVMISSNAIIGTESTNAIYNLANVAISGGTVSTIRNGYTKQEDSTIVNGIVVVSSGNVSKIINDGTVNASGGTISNVENRASFEIDGASVVNLINDEGTDHESVTTLNSGSVDDAKVNAGQFIMNLGTAVNVTNSADFDMLGGNITTLLTNEAGVAAISGGEIEAVLVNGGELEITDGIIKTLTNYALAKVKENAQITVQAINYLTLNIESGTINELVNNSATGESGESITTISGGSISAGTVNGGQVILENGNIIGEVLVNGGTLAVNDGTISSIVNSGTTNIVGGIVASVTVNDGIVNISGGEITNGLLNKAQTNITGGSIKGNIAVENDGAGTLTASGGEIIGVEIGISNISYEASITVEGEASISGETGVKNSGILNITGGIVSGSKYGVHNVLASVSNEEEGVEAMAVAEPQFTFTGGEVQATGENSGVYGIYNTSGVAQIGENDGSVSIEIPKLSSNGDVAIYKEAGVVKFYDGILYGKDYTCAQLENGNIVYGCNESIDEVPDGYGVRTRDVSVDGFNYNKDSHLIVAQARVISPEPIEVFKTLQAAIDWIEGEGTIQIVSNGEECVTISSAQNITLLMNGKTIRCVNEGVPVIENEGSLTISGKGTIESTQYYGIITSNKLVVNDVTINGVNGAIKNSGTGVMEINSGTITGSTVGIENTSSSDTAVTISGGTIQVNDGGTNAISNSQGTLTISETAIIFASGATTINNSGTLNVNGGTIGFISDEGTIDNIAISNTGTLNITDGTVKALTYAINEQGTSTISGGEISATATEGESAAIYIDESALSVTISGTASITSSIAAIDNNSLLEINGGTIGHIITTLETTINGGTISSIAVESGTLDMTDGEVSGNITNNGDMEMSGGKVSGIITNLSELNITGGEVNSIVNNGGNVTIEGGTINSITNNAGTITINNGVVGVIINNKVDNNDGTVNINGGTINSGITNNSVMNILGGTISTSSNAIVNSGTLVIGVDDGVIAGSPIISSSNGYAIVSTGTLNYFDGLLKGSIANSYTYQINDEELFANGGFGEYTEIVDSQYVTKLVMNIARIGSTYYNTIKGAIDASINGDTITLLANVTEFALEVPSDANIILDLNGYTLNNYTDARISSGNAYSFITVNGSLTIKEPSDSQAVSKIETFNALTVGIENNGELTLGTMSDITTSALVIQSLKAPVLSNPGYIFTYNNGVMKSLISNVFNCQNKDLYIRSGSIVVFNEDNGIFTSSLQIGEILGELTYDSYVEEQKDDNGNSIKDLNVIVQHEREVTSVNEKIEVYFRTKEPGELLISCSTDKTISTCMMENFSDKSAYLYNAIYEHELLVKYSNYDEAGNILSMEIIRETLLIRHDVNPGLVADVEVPAGSGYELRSDGQILLISLYTSAEVDLNIDELKTILFGEHWTTIVDSLSINTIEATTGVCDDNYLGCVEIYEMEATIGEITFKEGYRAFSTGTSLGFNTLIYNYSPKLAAEVQAVNTCELGEECEVSALSFKDYNGETIDNVVTIITLEGKVVDKIDTSKLGNYVVTSIATDKYGNVSGKVERRYSVVDTIAPVLKVSDKALVISKGGVIEDLDDIIAYDNYDNIVMVERITDEIDVNKAGTYRMTYKAIDSSGNITIVYRDVIVQDIDSDSNKKPLIIAGVSSLIALVGAAGAVVFIKKKKKI